MKPLNIKQFIIALLRRGTYKWPPRTEAMRNARVARGKYECAMCSCLFGPKEIKVDHVEPVVNVTKGFENWDTYISRMYPEDPNKFQILCISCHDSKTAVERELRKKYRPKKKKVIKLLTVRKK
jgi:5-methylcytosine-specific restriction endonuclease McrA